MDNLVDRVAHYCTEHQLLKPGSTVIIGLSGGPDSVFLLHTLSHLSPSLQITVIAAHLDHGWRTESEQERQFCSTMAKGLNIPFEWSHAKDIRLTTEPKGSLEERGRLLRQTFFKNVQQQHNAQTIALAHHHDDQKETFFIRLIRGAGAAGLAGIHPKDGDYIHPLLCCTKQEILSFLQSKSIPYCEDPSNRETRFLRNKIRLIALPALRKCDNRFDHSIARTMTLLRETDDFIKDTTRQTLELISHFEGPVRLLNREQFGTLHPYLQQQVILQWLIESRCYFIPSKALIKEIARFLSNKKSIRHTLYARWSIIKQGKYARLETNED
ncbi:TPA: tRNA lysidine(34) synthetase TilS [Candidatus Dependentiae bacterium]|nr:tRNA lysidine(34) synthetase TilS [Candidatus Dependentiae bacterium]